jgi:hypothetical protein
MKIKFIKDLNASGLHFKKGEIHNVISKKEADKWNNYVRYQITIAGLIGRINIPSMYVEEIN